jgi:hypothetical protein
MDSGWASRRPVEDLTPCRAPATREDRSMADVRRYAVLVPSFPLPYMVQVEPSHTKSSGFCERSCANIMGRSGNRCVGEELESAASDDKRKNSPIINPMPQSPGKSDAHETALIDRGSHANHQSGPNMGRFSRLLSGSA